MDKRLEEISLQKPTAQAGAPTEHPPVRPSRHQALPMQTQLPALFSCTPLTINGHQIVINRNKFRELRESNVQRFTNHQSTMFSRKQSSILLWIPAVWSSCPSPMAFMRTSLFCFFRCCVLYFIHLCLPQSTDSCLEYPQIWLKIGLGVQHIFPIHIDPSWLWCINSKSMSWEPLWLDTLFTSVSMGWVFPDARPCVKCWTQIISFDLGNNPEAKICNCSPILQVRIPRLPKVSRLAQGHADQNQIRQSNCTAWALKF